jgi:hypothetical protein
MPFAVGERLRQLGPLHPLAAFHFGVAGEQLPCAAFEPARDR